MLSQGFTGPSTNGIASFMTGREWGEEWGEVGRGEWGVESGERRVCERL